MKFFFFSKNTSFTYKYSNILRTESSVFIEKEYNGAYIYIYHTTPCD